MVVLPQMQEDVVPSVGAVLAQQTLKRLDVTVDVIVDFKLFDVEKDFAARFADVHKLWVAVRHVVVVLIPSERRMPTFGANSVVNFFFLLILYIQFSFNFCGF